jgi:hypothetical protein
MVAEYVERALSCERLAAAENDPNLKTNLESKPSVIGSLRPPEHNNMGKGSGQAVANQMIEVSLIINQVAAK